MNVASLELCKELYELSGWDDTYLEWRFASSNDTMFPRSWVINAQQKNGKHITEKDIPAYDLGYLLRKLPAEYKDNTFVLGKSAKDGHYTVAYVWAEKYQSLFKQTADTPEDACAKLAIELFKQRILK